MLLLLAVIVILPTVCLLWFMTQSVKNVRLAIKEKLLVVYQNNIKQSIQQHLNPKWIDMNVSPIVASDAFLVYDSQNRLTFPVDDAHEDITQSDTFTHAFKLEHADNDPAAAIVEYRRIADTTSEETLRISADISQTRCLSKLKRPDEAITKLWLIISKYSDDKIFLRAQKCRAHLFLLELSRQTNNKDFKKELIKTFDYAVSGMADNDDLVFLGRKSHADKYIPSSLQLLALNRFIDYTKDIRYDSSFERKYKRAEYLIERVSKSIQLAEYFPSPTFADPIKHSSAVFRLNTQEQLYCHYNRQKGYLRMKVHSPKTISHWFTD